MTTEEYKEAANYWKAKGCRKMPMHLLCIKPVKMDVLFSEFKKLGYDSRQVLDYKTAGLS